MGHRRHSVGLRGLVPATIVGALLLTLSLATSALAVGPPFGARPSGVHIVDEAKAIPNAVESGLSETLRSLLERNRVDIVVYAQVKPKALTAEAAQIDAEALLAEWLVGGRPANGLVLLWNLDRPLKSAATAVAVGEGVAERVDAERLRQSIDQAMATSLAAGDWGAALTQAIVAISVGVGELGTPGESPAASDGPARTPRPEPTQEPGATREPVPTLGPVPPPGPPYPEPISGLRVYDYAGVLRRDTEQIVGERIRNIEARTGAQIVVYTQVKPESDTRSRAERDAIALMDQWGVGRKGFDDGLVILFDLTPDKCHGQVQLYAGPGYRAAFSTNDERQRIYEVDMLPSLRACDFDSALLFAMERLDETATAEHARNLQLARQIDAASGLVVAPLLLVLLVGWAGWSWLRYGRDPEYLDDASILMPAPPPSLTPAAAAVVMEGRAGRRALTTALVDLAARGEIAFRQRDRSSSGARVDLEITIPDDNDPRLARNRRTALGEPETRFLRVLKEKGGKVRLVTASDMPELREHIGDFEDRLEQAVAEHGWFRESPEKSVERWTFRAGVVAVIGAIGAFGGIQLPSSGLLLVGAALLVAAACIYLLARVMPQRTLEGARMYAQLAAYRRTLDRTLEHSRTMDQVVSAGVLPWVQTPDQAIVWGYALGLHDEVEEVLERSMDDVRSGAASPTRTYFPLWFTAGERGLGRSSSARALAPGLFSSSAIPDFGGMTAVLGTIGAAAASSSSGGGGGGFGGGGSGGGGGGAGGGF